MPGADAGTLAPRIETEEVDRTMKLNNLKDNPGARVARVRVGRGLGSGLGKTGGRGQKGQKSRSGVAIKGFEGGQMSVDRRTPKRGFRNIFRIDYAEVNLGRLQAAVDAGTIAAGAVLDHAALRAAGLTGKAKGGVRVLAKGTLSTALTLRVAGATRAATAAIEAAGGKVEIVKAQAAPQDA